MATKDLQSLVTNAKRIYETRLRSKLEPRHNDEFVAVEPTSGDFFLGKTLSEAIGAARQEHPDRMAHAMRIGHKTAIHFGASIR